MKYTFFIYFLVCCSFCNAQIQQHINEINSLFNSYTSFKAIENYGDTRGPEAKNIKASIVGTKINIKFELKPGNLLRKCNVSFDIQDCQISREYFDARKLYIYSKKGIEYTEGKWRDNYGTSGSTYEGTDKKLFNSWEFMTGNVILTDRLVNGLLAIQTATKEQHLTPTPNHPLDNASITLVSATFSEPNSNNRLDRNETGCIKVRIKNNSSNDAYGIKLLLTEKGSKSEHLQYEQITIVDKIPANSETDINIPIKASSSVENKLHNFNVELIYKTYSKELSLTIRSGNYSDPSGSKTIPMKRMTGNTYLIACKVNGLPLNFIFDTGASSVQISKGEAIFMLKNGYLAESDIAGKQQFQTASGDIIEGTRIIIRKIEIGGMVLRNVEASVVHSDNAPLLLGQSVLSRLGKIQIDYNNSTLTIIR